MKLPFWQINAGFALAVVLPVAALAAKDNAPDATGPLVHLDPLSVNAARFYVPQEQGWTVAEVPGFRLFSHGSATATPIGTRLQLVREAFGHLWPDVRLQGWIATVVVCADEQEFLKWAHATPAAFDRLTRSLRTPAGPVLLVNGADPMIHRTVGRAYVLAVLGDSSLPRWFQEGLAATLSQVELDGDRLRVGQITPDVRDAVSGDTLNAVNAWMMFSDLSETDQLATAASASTENGVEKKMLTNDRGDNVEVLLDGLPPTFGQFRWALMDEMERRRERRVQARAETDFSGYLNDTIVMDLDKILDPATPDSVRWRMNAWAFTHYSLFGAQQKYRAALSTLLQRQKQQLGRKPIELFREAYGASVTGFEIQLRSYAKAMNYAVPEFKLDQFKPAVPVWHEADEATVLLMKARTFLAQERPDETRDFLLKGLASSANRTPAYVHATAQLLARTDRPAAVQLLSSVEAKDGLDHGGRRLLAALRLDLLTAGDHRLGPQALTQVLKPLFASLNGGDQSEQLFVLIGRAWLVAEVPPKEENLNALRLGLSLHPRSQAIGDLLKQLERHS